MRWRTVYPTTVASFVACISFVNAFRGDATWYNVGLGSCGSIDKDSEYVAALSFRENPNNQRCSQQIRINYRGRSVVARVVDSCPGCSRYSLDLSPAVFKALAPLDAGRIEVNWNYV
ncbi:barwin-like endoglucanase [Coprinopsis marcescibilis]|uniref:Barwin-like endoglucanase n=1 Tax=Coprinopsis marcescibilis TaxID=230819 RepID=A0A5C3L8V0_COPMA|nr:barwin-like endoglucanase [Coprinopsis marcescibilis]